MNQLFKIYSDHKSHYEIFKLSKEKITPYITDLIKHKVKKRYVAWLAIKWAGNFFAYNSPVVWLFLVNNKKYSNSKCRYEAKGFFVSITTIDDAALYGDWETPLDNETMTKVIQYFNKLPKLKDYKTTCNDLNQIIGKPGTFSNS